MPVPTYDWTWEQGADLVMPFVYKEGSPAAAVNLSTGYKVRMDIRTGDVAQSLVFTFNSDDIVEIPSVDNVGSADNEAVLGSDGSINITVPRSLTLPGGAVYTAMAGGNSIFVYDLFIRTPANKQTKILSGKITVNKSNTLWL